MDREEIIKWLESLKAEIGKSEHRPLWHYAEALDMAIEALQAEPVVRCKDCVYCEPYAIDTGEDCMTGLWCEENQKDTTLQDFCSYGKRKGGDTE